jgi:hypothetical protein
MQSDIGIGSEVDILEELGRTFRKSSQKERLGVAWKTWKAILCCHSNFFKPSLIQFFYHNIIIKIIYLV